MHVRSAPGRVATVTLPDAMIAPQSCQVACLGVRVRALGVAVASLLQAAHLGVEPRSHVRAKNAKGPARPRTDGGPCWIPRACCHGRLH